MVKQRSIYAARRPLRRLEGWWTGLERFVNRLGSLAAHPYNPLYHLGTLLIFLLIVLTVTGAYLTLLYRPGSDRAYASVVLLSANWFGSLMRTVHRYASDALLLVAFLHAWKMFVSDRFWGSRWFAWVTGWVLLFLFWLTGTMGYFLVWDQAAQWLTEYAINLLRGAFAYSFLGPDAAARTFSFFVIILFLHVFIPLLLLVAVLVHVLRLARARYWSPRWLMIMSSLVLIALSLAWPVVNGEPADLGQLLQQVRLDWWYLGFLPLTSQWGNGLLWSISLAVMALVAALPWLLRGEHTGPAFVIAPKCTGCALCARECPYDAIAMQPRDDDTPFSSLAVVKPDLCTGCGVCVGACADAAIELEGLHAAVMRQDLVRASAQAHKAQAPIIVFTCDRHATLGTLPPLEGTTPVEALGLGVGGELPLIQAKLPARVNAGSWRDDQGKPQPVMTCVVPCMGMLHPQWAAETVAAGAAGAIMVTCPDADCAFREGPHWVAERMKRRRTLRAGNTYILTLAPGSRTEVMNQWRTMLGKATAAGLPVAAIGQTEPLPPSPGRLVQARHLAVGFLLLLLLFGFTLFLNQPARAALPAAAQIRLAINHSGKLMATASNLSPEVLAKLPPNVEPAQVLGGERFPVQIQLLVDGEKVLERSYRPRGLRREGSVYGLEDWWVQPGAHHLAINLMDDGASCRTVFSDTVTIAPGAAQILYFVHDQDKFVMR